MQFGRKIARQFRPVVSAIFFQISHSNPCGYLLIIAMHCDYITKQAHGEADYITKQAHGEAMLFLTYKGLKSRPRFIVCFTHSLIRFCYSIIGECEDNSGGEQSKRS